MVIATDRSKDKQVKHYLIILRFLTCLALAASLFPVNAQNQTATPNNSQIGSDELVHFGDVIDVDVLGGFDFDWRGTLTPEGFLDRMDSIAEPIYGLCRSEAEIGSAITKILGRTLRDPKVVVRVLDRSNRAVVRLDGAVRMATRFQLKRPVHLRELIVMAGGLIDGASGDISIFRPKDLSCRPAIIPASGTAQTPGPDNAPLVTNIKIADLLAGKITADPQILSGDLITVNRALPIYVIGAVVNPRPFFSREKITLSRLIATAGGLAKDADGTKVYIFRRDGLDVRSIEADLTKIKNGNSEDELLHAFDIIEVASKGGSKRKYPPIVANEQNVDRSRQELPLRIVD